jgi:glycosyltransferase involved in cell wall biosynthesis
MTPRNTGDERNGVVIFDYNWGGHIPAYHQLCVEAGCRSGLARVISLSGRPDEVRAAVLRRCPSDGRLLETPRAPELGRPPARDSSLRFLHRIPGGHWLWSRVRLHPRLRARHALTRWTACGRMLARLGVRPELVFFPYLDDMLEPALRAADIDRALGGHPWAGIFMEASDLRDPMRERRIVDRLPLLRGTSCVSVGVLDEAVVNMLCVALPDKQVTFVPDIADSSLPDNAPPQIEQLQRRARGRQVVGLLGHLTEVKNLGLFLEIATQPAQQDLFFLVAGQFEPLGVNPAVRRKLEEAAAGRWENVLALPQRLGSEGDFNALVASVDVLFAVYRDFTRSSNMLAKAAQAGRPILVADGYCMAERVRAYGLGAAIDASSPASVVAAIRRLLARPPAEADLERYAEEFSVERFQQQIITLLRSASGAPRTP